MSKTMLTSAALPAALLASLLGGCAQGPIEAQEPLGAEKVSGGPVAEGQTAEGQTAEGQTAEGPAEGGVAANVTDAKAMDVKTAGAAAGVTAGTANATASGGDDTPAATLNVSMAEDPAPLAEAAAAVEAGFEFDGPRIQAEDEVETRRRPDVTALDLAYTNSADFKQRFQESYIALSDLEAPLDVDETLELQEIFADIQKGKRERAMSKLESANNEAASAAFDFLIGQLHFEDAFNASRSDDEVQQAAAPALYEKALAAYVLATDTSQGGFARFRRAWDKIALIHYEAGRFKECIPAFAKVIELGKVDGLTYGLYAVALINEGHFLAAETAFRQAMMMQPTQAGWKQGLASALLGQENFTGAATLYGQLIEENPDTPKFWIRQGNAYLRLGETQRAAENLRIAHQLGGGSNATYNLLADIYSNEGLTELAVDAYLDALQQDADAQPNRAIKSARRMVRVGKITEASRLLDGLDAHFGDSLEEVKAIELQKLRARVAVSIGESEREIEILREIIDGAPLDGDAIVMLGEALGKGGEVEEAIQQFQYAAGIEGFEARAKKSHAQLLARQKRYQEAIPLIKGALQLEDTPALRDFLEAIEAADRRSGR